MASTEYTLVFTKEGKSGKTCDSLSSFNAVCLEGMPVPSYEAKDVYHNDWADQNGIELYDASSVKLKATEITIPMGIMGSNYSANYRSFLTWLTTDGTLMTVTCPYTGFTLKGAVFVKADPEPPNVYDGGVVLQFKLTLRITKPE